MRVEDIAGGYGDVVPIPRFYLLPLLRRPRQLIVRFCFHLVAVARFGGELGQAGAALGVLGDVIVDEAEDGRFLAGDVAQAGWLNFHKF